MSEEEHRDHLAEMKRSFLRQPLPAEDGQNLADDIAREREDPDERISPGS
jgi:hypothetical protein